MLQYAKNQAGELAMPKAYIVASINVTDPEGFEEYKNAAVKVRREAGGTLLVNGGRTEAIEGSFHNRIVVIEFETIEAARAAAAGYLALRHTRGASAPDYDSIIVEGV
jgi:uncharacterized protein (DUF1330 family)